MPLIFPVQLFNPATVKLQLVGRVITSPPSISGVGQALRTDGGGFWTVAMSGIVLRTPDKVRAWRAWEAELAAGVVRVTVPVLDVKYAPRPVIAGKPAPMGSLQETTVDSYFPQTFNYSSPAIIARIEFDTAFRGAQAVISIDRGSSVRGGETFSINHPNIGHRIYRIGRVINRNNQEFLINFQPPLREAVAANTAIDFNWPMVDCVLQSDSDIAPEITNGRSEVSISFREAF